MWRACGLPQGFMDGGRIVQEQHRSIHVISPIVLLSHYSHVISSIVLSSCPPVILSSCHFVVLSSHCPVIPLSCHPIISSSHCPIVLVLLSIFLPGLSSAVYSTTSRTTQLPSPSVDHWRTFDAMIGLHPCILTPHVSIRMLAKSAYLS
ncbi:hypothetical protein BC936DRAFT_138179 [Jimgerdemannia flammicorona]|uniref:Uncharacterized protein n=1 Tax=Jimgerdemannia flammicorona TaxID=994334 RepID=A0A433CW35_9FUNG|nr:hypothetical protein BC936DRAFT_138179 [Jimgerdemannia flammicorona]